MVPFFHGDKKSGIQQSIALVWKAGNNESPIGDDTPIDDSVDRAPQVAPQVPCHAMPGCQGLVAPGKLLTSIPTVEITIPILTNSLHPIPSIFPSFPPLSHFLPFTPICPPLPPNYPLFLVLATLGTFRGMLSATWPWYFRQARHSLEIPFANHLTPPPPRPTLYKACPCPSYSRRRDRNNCVCNLITYKM